MTKSCIFALIACTAVTLTGQAPVSASGTAPGKAGASTAKTSGRVSIKGVDYYYEVRGKGEPLLLLHGGLDVDRHVRDRCCRRSRPADGRSSRSTCRGTAGRTLGNRPIRCEAIADDMAALVKRLGHSKVDVLGYSFGGCVALRMAVQHPDRVRRLVLVSTPFADDGWYPEMRPQQKQVSAAMAPMMKDTPMYKTYAAVAPKLDDFPRLLDAMGDFMRQKYDWSAEVAKLKMPVMLVFGDADMSAPSTRSSSTSCWAAA